MTTPATPKRKPGRPRLQFQVELTVIGVPCPPEHAAAYREAWRRLYEAAGLIPAMNNVVEGVQGGSELGAQDEFPVSSISNNAQAEGNGQ